MIKTPICDLLGIEYPIFQGGMAWIADGKLAAAVSEGGGLGIIAAGNASADYVREQIHIVRGLTEKPFGVNVMLMSPSVNEVAPCWQRNTSLSSPPAPATRAST